MSGSPPSNIVYIIMCPLRSIYNKYAENRCFTWKQQTTYLRLLPQMALVSLQRHTNAPAFVLIASAIVLAIYQ